MNINDTNFHYTNQAENPPHTMTREAGHTSKKSIRENKIYNPTNKHKKQKNKQIKKRLYNTIQTISYEQMDSRVKKKVLGS